MIQDLRLNLHRRMQQNHVELDLSIVRFNANLSVQWTFFFDVIGPMGRLDDMRIFYEPAQFSATNERIGRVTSRFADVAVAARSNGYQPGDCTAQ
jgi:hypothetical protein